MITRRHPHARDLLRRERLAELPLTAAPKVHILWNRLHEARRFWSPPCHPIYGPSFAGYRKMLGLIRAARLEETRR